MASSKKITTDVNEEAIRPIKTDDGNKEMDMKKEPNVEDHLSREQNKIVDSALTKKKQKTETKKKLVQDFEDDSEETRNLLRRWIPSKKPSWLRNSVSEEHYSRAIQKQLTESDVSGERLVLPKSQVVKKFLPFLEKYKPETPSVTEVLVYGPDGKIHETMKMWGYDDDDDNDDKETTTNELVLTGWKKFVGDYKLKEICDFITVWMFMANDQICLAVDRTRLSLRNQVSKRISKEFEKSDEERSVA